MARKNSTRNGSKVGKADPLAVVKADEKGKAMGQALGPLRQVMGRDWNSGGVSTRRRVVLRRMTSGQAGDVILESALEALKRESPATISKT